MKAALNTKVNKLEIQRFHDYDTGDVNYTVTFNPGSSASKDLKIKKDGDDWKIVDKSLLAEYGRFEVAINNIIKANEIE